MSLSPTLSSGSIIIQNRDYTEQWFVAFKVFNEDLSCGGAITFAEISDNVHYRNTWIAVTNYTWQWKFYYFDQQNDKPFTAPISVRVTRTDDIQNVTEVITGYNTITNFNAGEQFDFENNFCKTDNPTLNPTLNPSNNPTYFPTPHNQMNSDDDAFIYIMCIGGVLLMFLIAFGVWYACRYKDPVNDKREANIIIVADRHHLRNVEVQSIQKESQSEKVKEWLNGFGFINYSDFFIENGFTSLEYIKRIRNDDDLNGIGITLKGHQIVIMSEIYKLQHDIVNDSDDTENDRNQACEEGGDASTHNEGQ